LFKLKSFSILIMIVIGSVLAIVLIAAYIFLGMKISESIVNADVKIFFWALYTVTLLTIVNLSMSIYFYTNIANKKGPLGPRGLKGKLGEKGENIECDNNTCKVKTVQIMIEEAIQKYKDENDITPMERKTICNMVNDNGTSSDGNKSKINSWEIEDLKLFRNHLYDKNSYSSYPELNNSIDERIKNQNDGESLDWVKGLIVTASNTISRPLESTNSEASECV
jgi:hypothetical protein